MLYKNNKDIILIRSSKEPYGWMGNMTGYWNGEPLTIEHEGYIFPSSENLFQALRFDLDPIITKEICNKNGFASKQIAKKYSDQYKVKPLTKQDVENMLFVLHLKVEQHPKLRDLLLETEDRIIIEDVSNRRGGNSLFWGCALVGQWWIGENGLGRMWIKLRDKII